MIPTRTTLGSGNPASDICPSALHHRETHTLSRSQRDHSVTHRKDYKPFQILKNVKDQLFYLIEFVSQCFNTSIILYIMLFVKDYLLFCLFIFAIWTSIMFIWASVINTMWVGAT